MCIFNRQANHRVINTEDQSKLNGIRFGCNKLNRLFISHLHGDHIFGLPSVILGVSFERDPELNESSPIDIYGPSGLAEYLSTVFRVCESRISCKLNIHELCQWNQPCSCKCKQVASQQIFPPLILIILICLFNQSILMVIEFGVVQTKNSEL